MDNNVKVVLTNGQVKYYNGNEEFDTLEGAFMAEKKNNPDFLTIRTDFLVELYKEAKVLSSNSRVDAPVNSYNRGIMYAIERILPNVATL